MTDEHHEGEWLLFEEAARYLSISTATLSRRVRNGEIKAHYRGASRTKYFPKAELDEYIREYQASLKQRKGAG
jgi:excisionase family DNA binding protein